MKTVDWELSGLLLSLRSKLDRAFNLIFESVKWGNVYQTFSKFFSYQKTNAIMTLP